MALSDSTSTSGVVSLVQAMQSSIPFSEWGSGRHRANSRCCQVAKSSRITGATFSSKGWGTDSAVLAAQQDEVRQPVGMLDGVAEGEHPGAGVGHQGEGGPHRLVEHGEPVLVAASRGRTRRPGGPSARSPAGPWSTTRK